ncbi:hypothetical protein CHS0354_028390 [Potamilus streckersoni]|uniref:Uncharacterized protein n=1 Tax=Potamilus streckersoni TaxID=2493646 RepID=A0AAE0RTU9_9BIVA|nr:hypothetical protein CHS0354_028390 [Potamilus streckersoni]
MPLTGVSLLFMAVLMVEIKAQGFRSNGVTFLGQTGLQAGNQLQTAFPFSNLGFGRSSTDTNGLTQTSFLQQLQSVPASSLSLGSISIVDPELLGPNEGLGHNSGQQSQSILTTGTAVSSGTQSGASTNNAAVSPYSLPSRISPLRGPNGEVFRITSDVLLPLISPDQFNRLPTLGGNGDAVTSTGEYINTLAPRPSGQSGSGFQFEPSFGPGFLGPPQFMF